MPSVESIPGAATGASGIMEITKLVEHRLPLLIRPVTGAVPQRLLGGACYLVLATVWQCFGNVLAEEAQIDFLC